MAPCPFQIRSILHQQRVEFGDQGLDFERLMLGQSLAPAGPYVGERATQSLQRAQSQADLQQHGDNKRGAQHQE